MTGWGGLLLGERVGGFLLFFFTFAVLLYCCCTVCFVETLLARSWLAVVGRRFCPVRVIYNDSISFVKAGGRGLSDKTYFLALLHSDISNSLKCLN